MLPSVGSSLGDPGHSAAFTWRWSGSVHVQVCFVLNAICLSNEVDVGTPEWLPSEMYSHCICDAYLCLALMGGLSQNRIAPKRTCGFI